MNFMFSSHGKRSLKKLDKAMAKRVMKKLAYWESTGNPLRYAEKITGTKDLFKYRVGHYRVIAYPDFNRDTIIILEVGHRGSIYYSLTDYL